jgi:hypothetical protein
MIPAMLAAPVIGSIIETVGKVADDLFTSDAERASAGLYAYKAESERLGQQVEINKIEAANNSTWRPMIGKVCGYGLGYHFLVYPALCWLWQLAQALGYLPMGFMQPPGLDIESLMALVTALLGLGVYRTAEKIKGKA